MSLYINNPITGDKIQVAENDFPDNMSWDSAMGACAVLGNGWRLSTKEELQVMYEQLHKQGKGNFQQYIYWSSSQSNTDEAWGLDFIINTAIVLYKRSNFKVRAVRTLP